MAFSNPFGDDPDFQYLALDRKKLMEEAPPYDAKTSCWIPDQKLGFIRATITATKGEEVTVLTDAHEVQCHSLEGASIFLNSSVGFEKWPPLFPSPNINKSLTLHVY